MNKNQKSNTSSATIDNNNDDEVVIRDTGGDLKIWQHGRWNDFQETKASPVASPVGLQSRGLPPKEITREAVDSPQKEKLAESRVLDTGLEGPFLGPLKPAFSDFSKKGGGFIKSDERVIDNFFQKKETKSVEPKQKQYGINKIVNKVNDVLNLKLNLESKKRLKRILFSYSRHARSLIDSLEILQRSEDSGGMGYKSAVSEKIMAAVKNILERIEKEGGIVIDEEKLVLQKAESALKSEDKKFKISPKTTLASPKEPMEDELSSFPKPDIIEKPVKEKFSETQGVPDLSAKHAAKEGIVEPIFIKPKLIKKSPIRESEFPKVARPVFQNSKQITEIKKKPVILGPVEELASFSLVDFRRIDNDPQIRVNKILKKINALAEDSLTKKAEGINAWRQSEVYQYYLKIGEESIRNRISIKQLIKDKQARKEEVLNMEEFEALSDLSQKLRF
jgi:hypothetical protein